MCIEHVDKNMRGLKTNDLVKMPDGRLGIYKNGGMKVRVVFSDGTYEYIYSSKLEKILPERILKILEATK